MPRDLVACSGLLPTAGWEMGKGMGRGEEKKTVGREKNQRGLVQCAHYISAKCATNAGTHYTVGRAAKTVDTLA